jgi:hypothetical protein
MIYPEVDRFFARGHCSSCQLRKVAEEIKRLGPRDGLPVPFEHLMLESDARITGTGRRDTDLKLHSGLDRFILAEDGSPFPARSGCPDCVEKHLAQAAVLLSEIRNGYADHMHWAIEHLERAATLCRDKEKAKRIHGISDGLFSRMDHVEHHIEAASLAIPDIKSELGIGTSVSRMMAIGHLAEAADECADLNPELAASIRSVRVRLQEGIDVSSEIAKLTQKVLDNHSMNK